MAQCRICGKSENEVELLEGIFQDKIDFICNYCHKTENIPIIRKVFPAEEKKEKLSVRQRMERLSSDKNERKIDKSEKKLVINIPKIRVPRKREDSPILLENYDWIVKTQRRKKKISQEQLANLLSIPLQTIKDIESGVASNFSLEDLVKIENFFQLKILRDSARENMLQKKEKIEPVIDQIKEKMEKEDRKFFKKISKLFFGKKDKKTT